MTDREALAERIVLALLTDESYQMLDVIPKRTNVDRIEIHRRYRTLKRTLPYLEASVRARREWVRNLLEAEIGANRH